MFTGIVRGMGTVAQWQPREGGALLGLQCPQLQPQRWCEGDSVAVSGCCLTVRQPDRNGFVADLSAETLRRTCLSRLGLGAQVNLEPALALGQPLGGHWVSGHVDGMARLLCVQAEGDNRCMRFGMPEALARFVAVKGSVTLDGVSLTVNRVEGREFEVNLIPHTLAVTTLGQRMAGDELNVEVDMIARYLERLLAEREPQ